MIYLPAIHRSHRSIRLPVFSSLLCQMPDDALHHDLACSFWMLPYSTSYGENYLNAKEPATSRKLEREKSTTGCLSCSPLLYIHGTIIAREKLSKTLKNSHFEKFFQNSLSALVRSLKHAASESSTLVMTSGHDIWSRYRSSISLLAPSSSMLSIAS